MDKPTCKGCQTRDEALGEQDLELMLAWDSAGQWKEACETAQARIKELETERDEARIDVALMRQALFGPKEAA